MKVAIVSDTHGVTKVIEYIKNLERFQYLNVLKNYYINR